MSDVTTLYGGPPTRRVRTRDLIAAGHDAAIVNKVLRMVDSAEYKRRQSAPGTKISIKAFGRDRRLPITNRFREAPAERTGD